VYKAGVALSGPHDARYFNLGFVETYDGADNPEAWACGTPPGPGVESTGQLLPGGRRPGVPDPDRPLRAGLRNGRELRARLPRPPGVAVSGHGDLVLMGSSRRS
jgi:hypothetical protein